MTLFGNDLVYWSVGEANRQVAGKTFTGNPCPQCGAREWSTFHGVDPMFASEFNPGEYCTFTCAGCGYEDGPHQC